MIGSSDGPTERVSRRSVLAAGTAGLVASTAGCVNQVQSMVSSDDTERTGLRITTVPADNDRQTVQIARQLNANLEAVGFNTSMNILSQTQFQRSILLDHDFDIYVGTRPRRRDPDFLYEMLHSSYADETGWQNPFEFIDSGIDSSLDSQRKLDDERERKDEVRDLLVQIVQEMPFVPICIPKGARAVQPDTSDAWTGYNLHSRLAYLGLEERVDGDVPNDLTSIIMDSRPTRNVNPFSTEHRNRGTYINLLYDSLAVDVAMAVDDDGELDDSLEPSDESDLVPWLAESWEWDGSGVTVTLREDCVFHDGEPLTAEDVKFTYDFLRDTSMRSELEDSTLPATNYRRHASTIESVAVVDEYTVTFTIETSKNIGEQAFLVPILPTHIWHPGEEEAPAQTDEDDIPTQQGRWSLLGDDNEELIVGSGPFQYAQSTERDSLTLERFDDHFTRADDVDLPEPEFETLEFLNDTSSASAVQQVEGGVADITTSRLETHVLDDAKDNDAIELIEPPSWTFYHIGFNTRNSPCSNQYFRHGVSRLLDREWIVENIFSGHARPIWTPVANEWLPEDDYLKPVASEWMDQRGIEFEDDDLTWDTDMEQDEEDSFNAPFAPFCGSDGDLDLDEARGAFEDAGYRYNENGQLVNH